MTKTYARLHALVHHHIKHYHDDLLVHDQRTIEEHPAMPFLHWTRACGTYMVLMPPADSSIWPAKDVQVPFLFSTTDRIGLLDAVVSQARYSAGNHAETLACHYCDGEDFRAISTQQALDMALAYYKRVRYEWDHKEPRRGRHPLDPLQNGMTDLALAHLPSRFQVTA